MEDGYPVIEAAVDEGECTEELAKSAKEQGEIKAKLTTTTTTTTTTITEEQIVEDYFPAADVEVEDEVIDAKALFTSGEENLWEHNGKEFKCCWSSAGKPTELQDMTVGELPAARSYGSPTGCGHMFGDTYHNGPKREGKCPVLASVLKEIAGEDFADVMYSLAASSLLQAGSAARVGPDGEPWAKNTKYVCMQKWKSGVMASSYSDSYCLADYEKAQEVATAHFVVAPDIAACEAKSATHTLKVCSLKGEAPDGRLSYSTKAYVPKSCFRISSVEVN
jgi:hypothetical protein